MFALEREIRKEVGDKKFEQGLERFLEMFNQALQENNETADKSNFANAYEQVE